MNSDRPAETIAKLADYMSRAARIRLSSGSVWATVGTSQRGAALAEQAPLLSACGRTKWPVGRRRPRLLRMGQQRSSCLNASPGS